ILQEQRHGLVNNLIADRHMDFLRSKFILTQDDCEEINAQMTQRKRASKFLDILLTKGPTAYDMFCEAIRIDRTQTFILELLNRDYENRLQNYRALVNPQQNRPIIREISPPNIRPPPPPRQLGLVTESLQPIEHQYTGAVTPPSSPDLSKGHLDKSEALMTSASSKSTAFTELSSEKQESLPTQESCALGAGGKPAGNVIDEQAAPGRVNTADILRSLSSSGTGPISSASERMLEFMSLSSSCPSSGSASSSPSIITGITEPLSSDKSFRIHRLSSRGGLEDDPEKMSPTPVAPEFVTSGVSPDNPESGHFFNSLPQSWVDTSGSEFLNCQSCIQGQHDPQSSKGGHQHAREVNMHEKNNNCWKGLTSNASPKEHQPTENCVVDGGSSEKNNNSSFCAGSDVSDRKHQDCNYPVAGSSSGHHGNKSTFSQNGSGGLCESAVCDQTNRFLELQRSAQNAGFTVSDSEDAGGGSYSGSRNSSHC
ncbi:hypothetical protein BaRGS_00020637, partial [Batillaria attramentaria]